MEFRVFALVNCISYNSAFYFYKFTQTWTEVLIAAMLTVLLFLNSRNKQNLNMPRLYQDIFAPFEDDFQKLCQQIVRKAKCCFLGIPENSF